MLVLPELVPQLLEEMLLPVKVLGNNAKNIDVSVVAIGFQPETSKDLHPVSNFLEINNLLFGCNRHFLHPSCNDFLELLNDFSLDLPELVGVIIKLGEDALDDGPVLLVLVGVAPFADDLVGVLEFLEVLIGGQVVGLLLAIVHI